MKKTKHFAIFSLLSVLAVGLFVPKVFASSASVYVSPSSKSVSVGDSFSVQVRVSSGAQVNAAEARLNFDASKLQFLSASDGAYTGYVKTPGSGNYYYVGGVITPLTGDNSLFSASFKAIASGSASLSISGAQVAYDGDGYSVSTSGGTVSISDPSSGGSSGGTTSKPKTTTPTKPGTTTPVVATDTTAPVLTGEPVIDKTQSTITFAYKTDEAATSALYYAKEGAEKQQLSLAEAKTEHTFTIGSETPLEPGVTYALELVLTDAAGNSSAALPYSVRTKGVTYKVKITDSAGKPLSNYPVQLHSDPIDGTTDAEGNVTFDDVTPGEHTLVFDIEGITVRQPVSVGAELVQAAADSTPQTVTMPFKLATTATSTAATNWWIWLPVAFIAGMIAMKLPYNAIKQRAVAKLPKPKKSAAA